MKDSLIFRHLWHADWSVDSGKRWVARAVREGASWRVAAPTPVGDTAAYVEALFAAGSVLAGFDMPIGMPAAYGALTGLIDFPTALEVFGEGAWAEFFSVAAVPEHVSVRRPFYPHRAGGGATRLSLWQGIGLDSAAALMRRCDLATPTRRAACPMFWTLGPSQVGKAALAGWREVIVPARRRGARLWPYDGVLSTLAGSGAPVLAETYPAEAYAHTGIVFGRTGSKRRQADRRTAVARLPGWARTHKIVFAPELADRLSDGFGPGPVGEDAFDALAGVLGMIEVVDGRRAEHPPWRDCAERWEGWILGQVN